MLRKPLEQFTIADWMAAQKSLGTSSFRQLKRVARVAGIPIPAAVRSINTDPVITFDFSLQAMSREVRLQDTQALAVFKNQLHDWAGSVCSLLRTKVVSMGLTSDRNTSGHVHLLDSFDYYIKMDSQYKAEPARIGFRFARHGVHLHYGAGRGYGGVQGSRWIDRLGYLRSTNPESLGKAGSGMRPPKDWFNSVLDAYLPRLVDICSQYCGEMIVNSDYFYLGV